jgi:hypothetical protein
MPDWIPVESSTVSEVAYDSEFEQIYVRFKSGTEYQYDACPPHVWAEFTAPGQSPGKYLNEVLKDKPYREV